MKFDPRHLFGRKSAPSVHAEPLATRHTDDFADAIALELRGVATQAIAQALGEREAHYLSAVLEESHFPLESLLITPADAETARELEGFLRVHEEIDPNFRQHFFAGIVQREYRSRRGATVRTATGFVPIIQLSDESIEVQTAEESFQISLRGRRVRFVATARLGTPVRRRMDIGTSEIATAATAVTTGDRSRDDAAPSTPRIRLRVVDARGERIEEVSLPAIVGRDPGVDPVPAGASLVSVQARYASRRHLVVFSLLGAPRICLHDAATLSCLTLDGAVYQHGRLYWVDEMKGISLVLGVPLDHDGAPLGLSDRSEFPLVEIIPSAGSALMPAGGTPRPRAAHR